MLPEIPTLDTLRARMTADLDYRLPRLQARTNKSVLGVLTTVIAGAINSLYAFAAWMARQLNPLTASPEWLAIWASRLNVPRKPATHATGTVRISAEEARPVPVGTRLIYPTTTEIYVTTAEGSSGDIIPAQALTAGFAGNLPASETLQLESPITGVQPEAEAVDEFQGGADIETEADWAARVAERLAERQKIGDADDFRRWTKASHAGIIDALVYPNTPYFGAVTVRALGVADQPLIDDDVISAARERLTTLKNACGHVYLLPVELTPIAIKIADVTEADQAMITQRINDLFRTRTRFNAQVWPQEIQRIIASVTDTYTLLDPVDKISVTDHHILSVGGIEWL